MAAEKNIILGITGGIAAYKACDLIRLFVKGGIRVHPVMTPSATKFITPLTLSYLSSNKVHVDIFDEQIDWDIEHISLVDKCDLMLIAPATANIIAKIAHGLADDFVSLTALSFCGSGGKQLHIAPAMNYRMWRNQVTAENVKLLKNRGVVFIDPDEGDLACGETGEGRLADVKHIYDVVLRAMGKTYDFKGVNAIVTAGGTSEPIDPVRVITNRSSGKMGYAIAAELKARGATVTLISSADLPNPDVDKIIHFESTSDLINILESGFSSCNLLVMAAAVADYTVDNPASEKIHRSEGTKTIDLIPTRDIIGHLAKDKGDRFLVGFAAETEKLIEHASEKLISKKLDLVVGNDISRRDIGFGSDFNEVVLVSSDKTVTLSRALKTELAVGIVNRIAELMLNK